MNRTIKGQEAFPRANSPIGEGAREMVRVDFRFFDIEPLEVTTDDLVELVAGLYKDGRTARSAGDDFGWIAGFQEARLLVVSHRSSLTEGQLGSLRQKLDAAGYYQEEEIGDPYGLGLLSCSAPEVL